MIGQLLDNAIGVVSPAAAARRLGDRTVLAAHRAAIEQNPALDPYAPTSRLLAHQQSSQAKKGNVRDRSRAADKLSPTGRAILDRLTDNVVGVEPEIRPTTKNDDFNKESREEFRNWLETAEVTGQYSGLELMRAHYRNTDRDGCSALVFVGRRGERSRLQLIQDTQIGSPGYGFSGANQSTILQGREFNRFGRLVRLHIRRRTAIGNSTSEPVDIRNVAYFRRGQHPCGEPLLEPVLDLLGKLDEYVDAVVTCARMSAVFGLIFKSGNPGAQAGNLPLLQQQNQQGQNATQRALTVQNGMARYIGQEDDVVQVQAQQPMQQTPEFIETLMRLIGNALNLPFELVALNFAKSNFHSSRASLQQFYRHGRIRQKLYGGQNNWGKIYRMWVSRQVQNGAFISRVPENYLAHSFRGDAWASAKRLEDLQASLLAINIGMSSPQREADALGLNVETLAVELSEARELFEKNGLEIPYSNYVQSLTNGAGAIPEVNDVEED